MRHQRLSNAETLPYLSALKHSAREESTLISQNLTAL